jgi:hypothetical protein
VAAGGRIVPTLRGRSFGEDERARIHKHVVARIRDQLRVRVRACRGYAPNPVAIVLDSQAVRAAETVGKTSRGYDGAKKINGRKRHLAVDLGGLPVMVMVTSAPRTDRDAARELLARLRLAHPELACAWADRAYAGIRGRPTSETQGRAKL